MSKAQPAPFNSQSVLTTTPLPASKKVCREGPLHGVRAPFREVTLSNDKTFLLYDTSGPYTDKKSPINVMQGIEETRSNWILDLSLIHI